jgi:hypothetical protein
MKYFLLVNTADRHSDRLQQWTHRIILRYKDMDDSPNDVLDRTLNGSIADSTCPSLVALDANSHLYGAFALLPQGTR